MSVSEFPSSRGGLRLGIDQNTFEGTDLADAQSVRDAYFVSNPSKLAIYDANSSLMIRLAYFDGVMAETKFMVRIAGVWTDYTPVVQGLPGEVASLVGVPIGEIPYKLTDGTFGGSGMRVLENGSILAPPGFGVESGSVTFGDVLKLSEVAGFLGISNLLNERQYTIVDYYTPRTAISSEPTVFHLIEPEFEFISQGVDTTNLPDNPLIYNYTVINNARTNAIKFRTYAAMTNVRIKISQVSNGVALKFLPNKTSWEKELDGLNWSVGDNTFDFTDSPVILSAGNILKFEIRADSVSLKGNALGAPYFTATLQRGVFDDVITSRVYTATDIKTKLETLLSPNKLSKSAIQDVVNTVNGAFGDVVISNATLGAQPLDATLTALAALVTAADQIVYATGVDSFSQTTLTAYARTLLDDTSAASARSTLGLGNVATRDVDVVNGIATLDGAGKLTQMPTKADVGLGNVDNTSDVNKPVSTAQSAAIVASIAVHNAAVDPHPQYTTVYEASAAAPVQSVAGKTGIVTLTTGDVSEASNLYYTDARVGAYITTNGYNVKTVASSGAGSSVFNQNVSGAVTLRSIIGTGQASVTQNTNDITINVPAAPVQSVNGQTGTVVLSTTNVSEGTNLYYTDARVLTYFNTLGYTVKSLNNIGTGANVFSNTTSGVSSLRSILGGGAVTVTQNTNDITISAPSATVTSVGSVGAGSSVYQTNTAGAVTLRSVIGTGIATVTQNTNDITVNVPAPVYPVTSVNSQTGAVVLTTTNVAEGTNLYYTDTRVGNYLTTNGYVVKTIVTIGGGASLINSVGPAATFRSVIGTGSVTVTQNTNDVTINVPTITTATYTPTLFNTTNVSASTAYQCQYMRVGSMVHVTGKVDIDPTNNNQATTLGISLPIASNLGAEEDCAGTAVSSEVAGMAGSVLGDITNDRATIQYVAGSNANHKFTFSFMYEII